MWPDSNDRLEAVAGGIITTEVTLPTLRPIAAAALAVCAAGCFAPVPYDRHDLVDFRIVGVQVSDAAPEPGAVITAKALVYGGDGFYHDALPTLAWSLGEQVGEGPLVDLAVPTEPGEWELGLVATHADGVLQETAVLPLRVGLGLGPLPSPSLPAVQRAVIELPLGSTAEAFTLDSRLGLDAAREAGPVTGQAARLRLPLDDPDGRYRARWMSAGGQGTFMELDALTTDWVPADVLLDAEDLEVEVGEPIEPGLQGMAVLVIDEGGSTAWAFVDIPWDTEPSSGSDGEEDWLEHDGRLSPGSWSPPGERGLVEATLQRDDESPWGLTLRNIQPTEPWTGGDPLDNLSIPCEHPIPARGPFQLDWIAEGLCSREAVEGLRVRLAAGWPIATWEGSP